MMRPVYLGMFALILVLALIAGCSSDSGTDITMKQGNPNDATFLTVKAEVNKIIDSVFVSGFEPLTNPWGFPLDSISDWPDYASLHPDDEVTYEYDPSEGWYLLEVTSLATSVNSVVVDSVMFLRDDNPSSHYNTHTTGIELKQHRVTTYDGDEADYVESEFHCYSSYTEVDRPSCKLDGEFDINVDYYVTTASSTTHQDWNYTINIEDVQFDRNEGYIWEDNTPSDGNITMVVAFTNEVTENNSSTNTTTNWNFTVNVSEDGAANIEAVSNNTIWTYSETFGN